NINNCDNDDAEKHRVRNLFACREDNLRSLLASESAPKFALANSELAYHVFNDHHSAVDDQSEINRAQAHQITRHSELQHSSQRKEKRKRNRSGDNESGAPISEQCKKQGNNKHGAFEKIVAHGVD